MRSSLVYPIALILAASCKEAGGPDPVITITPDTAQLLVGDTRQFTALGGGNSVVWSSSNEQVASVVAQTGFVRGLSRGQSIISAASGSASATANVSVLAPPRLALAQSAVSFTMPVGAADPAARTVAVTNDGDLTIAGMTLGTIAYGASQPTGWLTATLSGSTAPANITLSVRSQGLARGTYTATVPVLASGVANSPQSISVTFAIQAPASIVLSRDTVPIATIPAQTRVETVNITNGGDVPLTGLSASITYPAGQPQSWLQASFGTNSAAPALLTLTANTTGLAVGVYTATVAVSSTVAGVAARNVAVRLVVNPGPSIQLAPPNLGVFAASGTSPAAQTVNVSNGGGGTLTALTLGAVTFGAGASGWLQAALNVTTAPAVITLTITSATLATGSYTATLPVQSTVASNSPVSLTVTLTIGPPPSIAVNPANVSFSGWRGGSVQGAQAVQITNAGGSVLNGLQASIQYTVGTAGWLNAQLSGQTAPASLQLQPNTTGLAAGTYTAVVTISSSTLPQLTPRTVTVNYTIQTFTTSVYSFLAGCSGACHGGALPSTSGTASQVYTQLSPYFANLPCKLTTGTSCTHSLKFAANNPGIVALVQWIAAGTLFF